MGFYLENLEHMSFDMAVAGDCMVVVVADCMVVAEDNHLRIIYRLFIFWRKLNECLPCCDWYGFWLPILPKIDFRISEKFYLDAIRDLFLLWNSIVSVKVCNRYIDWEIFLLNIVLYSLSERIYLLTLLWWIRICWPIRILIARIT